MLLNAVSRGCCLHVGCSPSRGCVVGLCWRALGFVRCLHELLCISVPQARPGIMPWALLQLSLPYVHDLLLLEWVLLNKDPEPEPQPAHLLPACIQFQPMSDAPVHLVSFPASVCITIVIKLIQGSTYCIKKPNHISLPPRYPCQWHFAKTSSGTTVWSLQKSKCILLPSVNW